MQNPYAPPSSPDSKNGSPELPPFDPAAERRIAWWLVLAVLLTLTAVKPLGGIAIVGTVAFTIAAMLQLVLPLWRAEKLGRDWDFVGLHLRVWRKDLKIVLILCAITFPPFALAHHLYMTEAHGWAVALGLGDLARFIPQRMFSPQLPQTLGSWITGSGWFLHMAATHGLGVALPEETFYRGYLQPRLEELWPPARRIFGVPFGKAAIVVCALFALGHFLGEWNPMRLGPFLPALVFAWQRNATGSVVGAITFHAACNILGEVLFALYQPV